ncbi:variable surface protein [Plasmodium gonderi]|uniref:Variable surface protein n=1 Tax=Plasmodium gonderi TaxID=77519 RepID=A0A1Y1JHM3_PLAGO|nr:variable surface protein [Plasmodium gonderi]GAW82021.1 variable surface protein [Plasmodium gonderi]
MKHSKNNEYEKYINEGQCAPQYEALGLCHTYFFKEFNFYPRVLSIKDEYINDISKFHDPILTYVALYLYHNYGIAHQYFNKKNQKRYNTACAALNTWLDEQKNLYTNFGRCYYNLRWWNIHIEPLWDKLKQYYSDESCKRVYSYYFKDVARRNPNINDRCYKQEVEEHVCFKKDDKDKNSIKENCAKLSILFYLGEKYKLFGENTEATSTTSNNYCDKSPPEKINYSPVLKAEKSYICKSLISTIALPISVTVLGTIFLAFFLNEFTPIVSIFRTGPKHKVRLSENFNEEAYYEQYKTYRNNNQNIDQEKNNIYYQSMNK